MQVILLEKVTNLGNLGDAVSVKPGYGRNYLIPRGKATPATAANRAKFDARRAELEKVAGENLAAAQARREKLNGMVVTVSSKAGDEGKLFGSIGTSDIADAVTQAGIAIKKQEVRLPSGLIRNIGDVEVEVHLHPDVDARITIRVVSEA